MTYDQLRALAIKNAIDYDNAFMETLTDNSVPLVPDTDTTYAQIRADTLAQAQAVQSYFTPKTQTQTQTQPVNPFQPITGSLPEQNNNVVLLIILGIIIFLIFVR